MAWEQDYQDRVLDWKRALPGKQSVIVTYPASATRSADHLPGAGSHDLMSIWVRADVWESVPKLSSAEGACDWRI